MAPPDGLEGSPPHSGDPLRWYAAPSRLASFHFALGSDEWYSVVDLPDNAAAAAIALVGTASGTLRSRAIALITPEEMDAITAMAPDFRPPGE